MTRKILVLHGYIQNAALFSKWFAPVKEAVASDNIEFVFVDGGRILTPEDIPTGVIPPPDLPLITQPPTDFTDLAQLPFGWWKSFPDPNGTEGLEESITKLRDVLKTDTFEGIVGFSQGASVAVILSALLEKPDTYAPFLVDGKAPQPPFKFCVALSGTLPVSPLTTVLFASPYNTPTLHIQGKNDPVTPKEANEALVKVAANKKRLAHKGGHIIPVEAGWLQFFKQFFSDPMADFPLLEGVLAA